MHEKISNSREINFGRKIGSRKKPGRPWKKYVEDWTGASVWRVGRMEEDREMCRSSIKAANPGVKLKNCKKHN